MLRHLIFNQLRRSSCVVSRNCFPALTSARLIRDFSQQLLPTKHLVSQVGSVQPSVNVTLNDPPVGPINESLQKLRELVNNRDWKYFAKGFYRYSQELKKKHQFPSSIEQIEIIDLMKAARKDSRMKRGQLINCFRSLYELGFSLENEKTALPLKLLCSRCLVLKENDELLKSDCILFMNALRKFGFNWNRDFEKDKEEKERILSLFAFVNTEVISEIQYKELIVAIDMIKIPWKELPSSFINHFISDVILAKDQFDRMSSRVFLHAFVEAVQVKNHQTESSTAVKEKEAIMETIMKMSKDILDSTPSENEHVSAWTREVR
jgi:hypothetical protein